MTSGFSLYLDLFRIGAMLILVVSHAMLPQMGGSGYSLSLEALQGLFVLSGFLTAHAAATRDRSLASFAAARLSKFWHVLLPSLALTPLIDMIGQSFSLEPYQEWDVFMGFDHPVLRLISAATFTNQIWLISMSPLSNVPLWTISYLAWFCAIFAAFVFSPKRWRFWAAAAVACIAGPRLLFLMPGWLMGAWLYSRLGTAKASLALSSTLFVAGPLGILILKGLRVANILFAATIQVLGPDTFYPYFVYSHSFVWQFVLSILFCVHFIGAIGLASAFAAWLAPSGRALRFGAEMCYAVYALHFPLQLMLAAMLHGTADGPLKTGLIAGASIVAPAIVGAGLLPLRGKLRTALINIFARACESPFPRAR